jgi:hypothetical protein
MEADLDRVENDEYGQPDGQKMSQREVTVNDSWISLSDVEWLMLKPRSRYRARMAVHRSARAEHCADVRILS